MDYIMKKNFCFLLIISLLICFSARSEASNKQITVEEFSNGYIGITELTIEKLTIDARGTKVVPDTKTYSIKNSSGNILASYTLKASFEYTGTSALCKSASYETSTPSSAWRFTNATASRSGATAYGAFTAKSLKDTISRELTLTCSADGKVS